jgi:hypothetical protein
LGPRYKGGHIVKLVCHQYNTFHENYFKVFEILREIYWESIRAPITPVNTIRNPYRREYLKKKLWGKTREERIARMKAFDEELI